MLNHYSLHIFVAIVALMPATMVSADDIAGSSSIVVEVRPHKYSILIGEPLVVSMKVTSHASEVVEIIHHNSPTLSRRELSIVDLLLGTDAEHMEHWSDLLRPLYRTSPRRLAPRERVEIDLVMLFNSEDGFFATKSGKYWIQGRAVTTLKEQEYTEFLSEPIEIEVREPTPTERGTWMWLDGHKEEYGRLVQIPWEVKPSESFLAECDRLCRETSTPYVEYLAYFLSRSYREGPNKNAEQSTRYAEIAKTKATSEKIRTEAEKLLPPPSAPNTTP